MRAPFVQVDFSNLMDAGKIASERGGRVRLSDREAVTLFCLEEGMDLSWGQAFALAQRLPMATILTSGLMRGFYLYCIESERAFRYIDDAQEARPLRTYTRAMEFDLALSYASEDRSEVALPLAAALERAGVRCYVLDVAEDPEDPLWGVRFREAVFHSYFFSPVLTDNYLARAGSANELFDLARMAVEHRSEEFFYPLTPLVPSLSSLPAVLSNLGELARSLDPKGFEWLRTHIMPFGLDRGVPWLAQFFKSLAKNARGSFDIGFLRCLEGDIEWVEWFTFSGDRKMARLLLRNPLLTYYILDVYESGVVRFTGLGEPQKDATRAADLGCVVERVLDHLGLEA